MNLVVPLCFLLTNFFSLAANPAVAELPLNPEVKACARLLGLRIWDAFTRRVEDIRRWNWRGRAAAPASDVEMALRDQSET